MDRPGLYEVWPYEQDDGTWGFTATRGRSVVCLGLGYPDRETAVLEALSVLDEIIAKGRKP